MPALRLAPGAAAPSAADFAGMGMMTIPGAAITKGLSGAAQTIKALIAKQRQDLVPVHRATHWADEGEGLNRWLGDLMKQRLARAAEVPQKLLPAAGGTTGAATSPAAMGREALLEMMRRPKGGT